MSIIFCFTCAHIIFSVMLNSEMIHLYRFISCCNPRQIVKPQLLYSIRSTITNWMLFADLIIIAFDVLPGPKGTLTKIVIILFSYNRDLAFLALTFHRNIYYYNMPKFLEYHYVSNKFSSLI